MQLLRSLESELSYAKKIAGAGWEGIASARQDVNRNPFAMAWMPTAVGAGIGIVTSLIRRRSASIAALGGMVGGAVGFGAGIAWGSKQFARTAARKSIRAINAVRDARWLERNPIDYA